MMILLWAREVLDAAFLHDSETRLFLVTVVYVFIAGALLFGCLALQNQRDYRLDE